MIFEQFDGAGLALRSKKRGIVGWVISTSNGMWACKTKARQTHGAMRLYQTKEEAKSALMYEVGIEAIDCT